MRRQGWMRWALAGGLVPLVGCSRPEVHAADAGAPVAAVAVAAPEAGLADAAPGPFEGTIDAVVSVPDPDRGDRTDESFHFVCRGGKVRWDIGRGYAYRVYDRDPRTIATVYPAEHTVTITHEEALGGDAGAPPAWTVETFDPNGAMAGEPCERVHVSAPRRPTTDACIVHGFPVLPLEVLSPSLAVAVPFAPRLRADGAFPLAAVTRSVDAGTPGPKLRPMRQGLAPVRFTVLRIERRPVAEDEVRVPPFKTIEVSTLQIGTAAKR